MLSIQDCLALCAEELACVSVTFQNTTSKCWLKNKEFGTPTKPLEGVKSANLRNPGKERAFGSIVQISLWYFLDFFLKL